jgi:hypothetical protein
VREKCPRKNVVKNRKKPKHHHRTTAAGRIVTFPLHYEQGRN